MSHGRLRANLGAGPCWTAATVAAALCSATAPSWATDLQGAQPTARQPARPGAGAHPTDGVYGRFEGDLDLGVGAGAELERGSMRAAAWMSAHYYSMIGASVSYRDSLSRGPEQTRVLALGVDLRPAFVPRWAENLEQGPSWLDLSVDSVSLGLGAFWEQNADGAFAATRGVQATVGVGLPLLARAEGPWLQVHGALRWPERPGAAAAAAVPSLLLSVCWHALFAPGLLARQAGD